MLTIVFNNSKGLEFENVTDFEEDDYEIRFNYTMDNKQYEARFMFNSIAGIVKEI